MLTILRRTIRTPAAGQGYTEVEGIAQFNANDATGELECLVKNVTDVGLALLGPPAGLVAATHAQLGDVSATLTFNVIVAKAGVIPAIVFVTPTAVAANDVNYWSFGVVNKGPANAGNTVVVDATAAANTTKATGGAAIVANTPRALTLSAVAGATTVAAGDVLVFTITKAAAATTMAQSAARVDVTTAGTDEQLYVDEDAQVNSSGILERPAVETLTIGRTGNLPSANRKFAFRYRGT